MPGATGPPGAITMLARPSASSAGEATSTEQGQARTAAHGAAAGAPVAGATTNALTALLAAITTGVGLPG